MKYVFCSENGAIVFNGRIEDSESAPAGCYGASEAELGGLSPVEWMKDKVWDAALGRPRSLSPQETLNAARKAKENELLTIFAERNRARFPTTDPKEPQDGPLWRFLGVYTTNQSDPRIVAFKADTNNLDTRLTSLARLGTSGNNPPLTLEEIAKIVW